MNRRERRAPRAQSSPFCASNIDQLLARQRSAVIAASQPDALAAAPVPESAVPESSATGPRTEDGKATSSRNAVKHNLCSKKLTGADLEELKRGRRR